MSRFGKSKLDFKEEFTLVSNGAAIHGDTNIKQSKSKYYNQLKE